MWFKLPKNVEKYAISKMWLENSKIHFWNKCVFALFSIEARNLPSLPKKLKKA